MARQLDARHYGVLALAALGLYYLAAPAQYQVEFAPDKLLKLRLSEQNRRVLGVVLLVVAYLLWQRLR